MEGATFITPEMKRLAVEINRDFMLADLEKSGLVPEDFPIRPRPCEELTSAGEAQYLLPVTDVYVKTRIDRESARYLSPSGMTPQNAVIGHPSDGEPVGIVEGLKKAVLFHLVTNYPVIALDSCSSATQTTTANLRELRAEVASAVSKASSVVVLLDGDCMNNPDVGRELKTLVGLIDDYASNCEVIAYDLGRLGGTKVGFDDWWVRREGKDRSKWASPSAAIAAVHALPPALLPGVEVSKSVSLRDVHAYRRYNFSMTDTGSRAVLVDLVGGPDNIKYVKPHDEFVVWRGDRWQSLLSTPCSLVDELSYHYAKRASELRARVAVLARISAASGAQDPRIKILEKKADACAKYEGVLSSAKKQSSVISALKQLPSIVLATDPFDADHTLLGTPNGVVELRTGTLRPATQADMVRRSTTVKYNPSAPSKLPCGRDVLQLIAETTAESHGNPSPERLDYFQRMCGAWISSNVDEQRFYLLCGGGSNGKSVVLELLAAAIGDVSASGYAAVMDPNVLVESRWGQTGDAASPSLVRAMGSRLARTSEVAGDATLNEAFMKRISGSDMVSARGLYSNGGGSVPKFSPVMLVNHLPAIKTGGDATWDRISPFEFKCRWTRPGREGTDPEADRFWVGAARSDSAVLEFILRWAVEGAAKYLRHGLGTLKSNQDLLDEYRSDQEFLEAVLADLGYEITGDAQDKVHGGMLYQEVNDYLLREPGMSELVMSSSKAFYAKIRNQLDRRKVVVKRGAQSKRFVHGVKLTGPSRPGPRF